MSKFNTTTKSKPDTTNLAGGEAYTKSPKLQIASIMLTNFCTGSYYESEQSFMDRLNEQYELLSEEDKIFLAKAAIYARIEFGMRSITHVAANIILDDLKEHKYPWAKSFFNHVIFRPDDMAEILSCYWKNGKRALPNSLLKGWKLAFNRFDDYQISKYLMSDKAISMVDIVNLVHPKPTEKNSKSLKEIVNGTIKPADTFMNDLAAAGRSASDETEKKQAKANVWEKFVAKGEKVEMFALLRNLRNIGLQASEDVQKEALKLLVDEKRIKKSKIMPFRLMTAYEEFADDNDSGCPRFWKQDVRLALEDAMDMSVANVPAFEGRTLVALDGSGSMWNGWGKPDFNGKDPVSKGAVFAAALAKSSKTDVCIFSNHARYVSGFSKRDSVMSIVRALLNSVEGGGTSHASVFSLAAENRAKYDRIIIITDEQAWIGNTRAAFSAYKRGLNCNPKLYIVDTNGHGQLQFPESNVCSVAGFNAEKVFEIMQNLDRDPKALIHAIEAIQL